MFDSCMMSKNRRSVWPGGIPPQDGQELRQDHRGCAPDLEAADSETRGDDRLVSAHDAYFLPVVAREQLGRRNLDDARDLEVRGPEERCGRSRGHHRVQSKPAHGNVNRREQSNRAHHRRLDPDFLMSFPDRGLFERLARIDDAPRQRDLAFVTSEPVGPNRQDDLRLVVARKDEKEARGVANCRRVETVGPLPPRFRRQKLLSRSSRERTSQTCFESPQRRFVGHWIRNLGERDLSVKEPRPRGGRAGRRRLE